MIILDTNVVSELMKPVPDPRVRDWMLAQKNMSFSTTAITVAEITFGLQRLPVGQRRTRLHQQFDACISVLPVLPLDDLAAQEAGRLRAQREAAGLSSQPSDMHIAGIASFFDASIATRNTDDFSHLSLQLLNPWLI